MRRPRKLTFQLVSLFDLLTIVIFAQYLDVQNRARERDRTLVARAAAVEHLHAERSADDIQAAADRDRLAAELKAALKRNDELARQLATVGQDAREQMALAQHNIESLAGVLAEMLRTSEAEVLRRLKQKSPADSAALAERLAQLTKGRSVETVRQFLAFAELGKRCDVWDVRIGDDNQVRVRMGGQNIAFRAATAAEFEERLMRLYRSVPQPKSLVLILLSWSDADLSARRAALDGLDRASERMRIDTDRRTRFEFAVLGYLPAENRET